MWKDKLVTVPAAVTLAMLLAGLALFAWHLAIHPEPQLTEPAEDVPLRTEGIAALVAVASRHDDDVALGFDPVVHGRDLRNFRRHLRHIALRQGWYPHDGGACRSLVAPEADLHLLYEMERDPVAWVHRYGGEPASVRVFQERDLVNASVCAGGQRLSGALRVLAIVVWVLSIVPGLIFLADLGDERPSDRRSARAG